MYFQAWVMAPASKPRPTATSANLPLSPVHPPAERSPRNTSGANPKTIKKNWRTSL